MVTNTCVCFDAITCCVFYSLVFLHIGKDERLKIIASEALKPEMFSISFLVANM